MTCLVKAGLDTIHSFILNKGDYKHLKHSWMYLRWARGWGSDYLVKRSVPNLEVQPLFILLQDCISLWAVHSNQQVYIILHTLYKSMQAIRLLWLEVLFTVLETADNFYEIFIDYRLCTFYKFVLCYIV